MGSDAVNKPIGNGLFGCRAPVFAAGGGYKVDGRIPFANKPVKDLKPIMCFT